MVSVKMMDPSRGLLILGFTVLSLVCRCTPAPIYHTDYEDLDKIKVANLFVINPDREGDNTVVEIENDRCSPFLVKNLNKFIACLKSTSHVQARQASDVRTPTNNGIAKRSPLVPEFMKRFLSRSSVRPEATSPHEPQGPAVARAALQARIRPLVPWGYQEGNEAGDSPLRVQIGNLYLFEPHEVEGNAVIQLDTDPCERLILGPFSEYLDCVKKYSTFNTEIPKQGTRQTSHFLKNEESRKAFHSLREPGTQGWNTIQSLSKQDRSEKIPFQNIRNFANGYSGQHSIAAQETMTSPQSHRVRGRVMTSPRFHEVLGRMMTSPRSHRVLGGMKTKGVYPKWNSAQVPRRKPPSLVHQRMVLRRPGSRIPVSVVPADHSTRTVYDRPSGIKQMLVQRRVSRGR